MTIFKAENLCFNNFINYPQIHIQENCMTFITGKSGCGKSTFLKLLNSTIVPTGGEIYYKNQNIKSLNKIEYRKKVILSSQDVYLLDTSIKDNFQFFYSMREENMPEEAKITDFLNICALDIDLNSSCSVLSGGERQRVFLAIILSFMPDVILLDEPTSALDESTADLLLNNIKEFCKKNNITALVICHNENLTKKYADNIIALKEGTDNERNS